MTYNALAETLIAAASNRTAIRPLTDSRADLDADTAYAVQDAVVAARVRAGARVVGAKLGLTSAAKQQQMNVSEPLYGYLTDDMQIDPAQGVVCADFIQPRCEPEIAFLLGRDLAGDAVGIDEVLAATRLVFPAIDVLDSRFAGYTFTITDVIADNASAAGFSISDRGVDPLGIDLSSVECAFELNGVELSRATGAAVMGHPAESVAWMVRRLAARGRGLTAGQIVMSGALTEAVAISPGDMVVARFDRLGTVELRCLPHTGNVDDAQV